MCGNCLYLFGRSNVIDQNFLLFHLYKNNKNGQEIIDLRLSSRVIVQYI